MTVIKNIFWNTEQARLRAGFQNTYPVDGLFYPNERTCSLIRHSWRDHRQYVFVDLFSRCCCPTVSGAD